jgi:hypothetical protein
VTEHLQDLRGELLAMAAADDALRERLAESGTLFDGYDPTMEALHVANAGRLESIVARYGWPGRSLVGEDGASAAWRIVHHAISCPDFMRRMHLLIRSAAERGEASLAEAAMLEDRINVYEGRRQTFGTQFDWNDTATAMVPMVGVADPHRVEERRRQVGLPAMEWTKPPPNDEPRPPNLTARQRQYDAWLKKVGWR